ncbi:lipase family protein [Xanthomonas albilineans]|uniref:lipase family protein n=1 Tax=Xanthomonas albilineans TaxID=29447 RepID=UPI001E5ECE6E|nr:hypothetical protein [Xanthomonas albilineans]
MNSVDQKRADAANDSYFNRPQSDVDNNRKYVSLGGNKYQIFGCANDPISGFHATAYRNRKTNEVIIAYRGTDPALFTGETKAEKRSHALTTLQDIAVDATMVRDAVNPQKAAADAFTAQMLAKAAKQGIPKDHVTVAGHSLGGALAQIEAAKYGLAGCLRRAGADRWHAAARLPRHQLPHGRRCGERRPVLMSAAWCRWPVMTMCRVCALAAIWMRPLAHRPRMCCWQ